MMLAVLTLSASASADSTPATRDGQSLVFHQHRARVILQDAYDTNRWRDPTPARSAEKREWQAHRNAILHDRTREAISFYRDRLSDRFDRYRLKRQSLAALTPYGKWAIPEYIVACESGGSWSAYNPSGAAGAYQIMPEWGRPWPVTSEADKIAHHRIAGRIWAGGAGASNWVCS